MRNELFSNTVSECRPRLVQKQREVGERTPRGRNHPLGSFILRKKCIKSLASEVGRKGSEHLGEAAVGFA